MKWKPFSPIITAVLAILAGLFFQIKHDSELASAQAETQLARQQAAVAVEGMSLALAYADSLGTVADAAEARAAESDRRAASIPRSAARHAADSAASVAPDTCAPALALARAATDAEHEAAEGWHDAYLDELQAAQALRQGADTVVGAAEPLVAATDHLSDAAGSLVKASSPSFFARLRPDVGLGAAVGVNPVTGAPSTTVGVTLSWRLL